MEAADVDGNSGSFSEDDDDDDVVNIVSRVSVSLFLSPVYLDRTQNASHTESRTIDLSKFKSTFRPFYSSNIRFYDFHR